MHTYTDPDDNFIIAAPTYKILQQATLPAFLKMMDGCGKYSKVDATFKMNDGGTCYFRTSSDPDSIIGVTNVRSIWLDEAGLMSSYFWANAQARSSFRQAQIVITTSPYSLNWLWKEFIRPHQKGEGREDCELIQASSNENPYFPDEEYEKKKATMDPLRFDMIYGGNFRKVLGLVYKCFDEEKHVIPAVTLPVGTKYFAGIDWGTTNPFAIVVRAVTPEARHYQVAEFYKTGMTIMDMIQIAKQLKQVWGIEKFYADPSSPGYIEEFNRARLTCIGADNRIEVGISAHYALIASDQFRIFEGSSPHTLDELSTYHYPNPKDIKPDQDEKGMPNPVKQNDHLMDAMRYVTMGTRHMATKKTIQAPVDTTKLSRRGRIERLKKGKKSQDQTEKWS